MLTTKKAVVSKLKEVQSNVLYELAIESPTIPLISYSTIDDSVLAYGTTLGYSNVKYQIKVWTDDLDELSTLTESIDSKMKSIGLTRTYYSEISNNNLIIGVMQYKGLVREEFI